MININIKYYIIKEQFIKYNILKNLCFNTNDVVFNIQKHHLLKTTIYN